MKPITQISNTSKTINTRTFSTQALRRISTATPEAFMRTTTDYANARAKERNTINCNTKRTPATTASKTINTRTLSDSVLCATFAGYMEKITAYASARRKERNRTNLNTKRTPATFEERADLNTPPAISDHVRELAPFLKNCNETTAHATTAKAFINHIPAFMTEHPRPLWTFNDWTHRTYATIDNINRADKPAFRHDSMYLFDILSEGYSA